MDAPVKPVLEAYSRGEISAEEAADSLGKGATVADVFVLSREAHLPLPDSDGPFECQQFERAKKLFERTEARSTTRQD
jgi:hypothetical protein